MITGPFAAYGWLVQMGFGGDLSGKDRVLLASPILFAGSLIFGLFWRTLDRGQEDDTADTEQDRKGPWSERLQEQEDEIKRRANEGEL